jgi:hypothetical protein
MRRKKKKKKLEIKPTATIYSTIRAYFAAGFGILFTGLGFGFGNARMLR